VGNEGFNDIIRTEGAAAVKPPQPLNLLRSFVY